MLKYFVNFSKSAGRAVGGSHSEPITSRDGMRRF